MFESDSRVFDRRLSSAKGFLRVGAIFAFTLAVASLVIALMIWPAFDVTLVFGLAVIAIWFIAGLMFGALFSYHSARSWLWGGTRVDQGLDRVLAGLHELNREMKQRADSAEFVEMGEALERSSDCLRAVLDKMNHLYENPQFIQQPQSRLELNVFQKQVRRIVRDIGATERALRRLVPR